MAELKTLADLKPAPYNPRKIKKDAAAGLGKSLDTFGDISGITWNKRTGNLVAGHQRVAQLRKRGAKLEFADGDDGDPRVVLYDSKGNVAKVFPVRIVDWDEGFEKAANVEANNRKIAGDFTPELGSVLTDVQKAMSELQFEELRFDDLKRDVLKARKELADSVEAEGFKAEYHVMVTCSDEKDQTALLERLESEGYKVRALMS